MFICECENHLKLFHWFYFNELYLFLNLQAVQMSFFSFTPFHWSIRTHLLLNLYESFIFHFTYNQYTCLQKNALYFNMNFISIVGIWKKTLFFNIHTSHVYIWLLKETMNCSIKKKIGRCIRQPIKITKSIIISFEILISVSNKRLYIISIPS